MYNLLASLKGEFDANPQILHSRKNLQPNEVVQIFIAHSHIDDEWCSGLADALKLAGYRLWYDQHSLSAGAQWVEEIGTELQTNGTESPLDLSGG
jgi:hypothetical protein